jgi:AbrB family looped-hinge helix DNA binding protein
MRRRTESLSTGYTATITRKGQFSLPLALCLKLGIKRGDKVAMEVVNGHTIVVQPLKPVPAGKKAA